MTKDQVQERLAQLKQEYELGESRLRDLAQQELALRETLLRISGAIQVLEELSGGDAENRPHWSQPGQRPAADAGAPDRASTPSQVSVP